MKRTVGSLLLGFLMVASILCCPLYIGVRAQLLMGCHPAVVGLGTQQLAEGPGLPPLPPRLHVAANELKVVAEGPGLPPLPPRIHAAVKHADIFIAEGPGLPPLPPRIRVHISTEYQAA